MERRLQSLSIGSFLWLIGSSVLFGFWQPLLLYWLLPSRIGLYATLFSSRTFRISQAP